MDLDTAARQDTPAQDRAFEARGPEPHAIDSGMSPEAHRLADAWFAARAEFDRQLEALAKRLPDDLPEYRRRLRALGKAGWSAHHASRRYDREWDRCRANTLTAGIPAYRLVDVIDRLIDRDMRGEATAQDRDALDVLPIVAWHVHEALRCLDDPHYERDWAVVARAYPPPLDRSVPSGVGRAPRPASGGCR